MLWRYLPPYSIILWCVTLHHLALAFGIVTTPSSLYTTPNTAMLMLCGSSRRLLVTALTVGAVSTGWLLVSRTVRTWHLWLGVVQQALLLATVVGTIYYASQGHYADGTPAPGAHIFYDQSWSLFFGLGHIIGLYGLHRTRGYLYADVAHAE